MIEIKTTVKVECDDLDYIKERLKELKYNVVYALDEKDNINLQLRTLEHVNDRLDTIICEIKEILDIEKSIKI